jgi:hypothetical protein
LWAEDEKKAVRKQPSAVSGQESEKIPNPDCEGGEEIADCGLVLSVVEVLTIAD